MNSRLDLVEKASRISDFRGLPPISKMDWSDPRVTCNTMLDTDFNLVIIKEGEDYVPRLTQLPKLTGNSVNLLLVNTNSINWVNCPIVFGILSTLLLARRSTFSSVKLHSSLGNFFTRQSLKSKYSSWRKWPNSAGNEVIPGHLLISR